MLTDKQQRFVDEYLIDMNATQAAIRTGYSEKTAKQQGSRLLTNVDVLAAVKAGQAKVAERIEVTQEYVLSSIVSTMERCKQHEPVLDRKGQPIVVQTDDGSYSAAYTFNAGGVLKGAELLGKHLGTFVERHEVTGKDGESLAPSAKEVAARIAFILKRSRKAA